jgi:TRAP-type uncharacterized transport system substrate-binding protein
VSRRSILRSGPRDAFEEAPIAALPEEPAATPRDEATGAFGLTRRDRVLGVALLLVAVLLVIGLVAAFWRPGPPEKVYMGSGTEDGAYEGFARRYREILARSGVELVLVPSAGAVANLDRLRRPDGGVDVVFAQGGLAQPGDETRLVSLGAVAYESLWFFHRASQPLERLDGLRGLRIAAGPPGSGTRRMMEVLLQNLGLSDMAAALVPLGGLKAAEALERGEIDVAMYVSAAEAPAIERLLHADGIELLSVVRADAYVRKIPVLTRVDIPEGAVDLRHNRPSKPVTLLALKALLVAKPDIHPVLIDLLLDAAREVHGGGSLVNAPGLFPAAEGSEYPMAGDAERYYKAGPSSLRSWLPYWAVVWVQRLIFLGLPVVLVGIPLLRLMPDLYRWTVRRRVYRWYGELSFLERAALEGKGPREAQLKRLDRIEARVNALRVPASFAGEAYTLREHVRLVRERLTAT